MKITKPQRFTEHRGEPCHPIRRSGLCPRTYFSNFSISRVVATSGYPVRGKLMVAPVGRAKARVGKPRFVKPSVFREPSAQRAFVGWAKRSVPRGFMRQ